MEFHAPPLQNTHTQNTMITVTRLETYIRSSGNPQPTSSACLCAFVFLSCVGLTLIISGSGQLVFYKESPECCLKPKNNIFKYKWVFTCSLLCIIFKSGIRDIDYFSIIELNCVSISFYFGSSKFFFFLGSCWVYHCPPEVSSCGQ